eukprot:3444540-Lingulodinium_polyedra.AAC.1
MATVELAPAPEALPLRCVATLSEQISGNCKYQDTTSWQLHERDWEHKQHRAFDHYIVATLSLR